MESLTPPSMPLMSLPNDTAMLADQARNRNPQALDSVAAGFESLFVSMLVKQMRQSLEPGTMFAQDNSDILGSLFDMTMGQHLAQAGGLGIGAMLKQQLAQRYAS